MALAFEEEKKTKDDESSTKKVTEKIRPDCSAVGLNLGDYSTRVRQRSPPKKERQNLLRLSDKFAVCFSSSRIPELKVAARRLW